jgi:hypothetical protein
MEAILTRFNLRRRFNCSKPTIQGLAPNEHSSADAQARERRDVGHTPSHKILYVSLGAPDRLRSLFEREDLVHFDFLILDIKGVREASQPDSAREESKKWLPRGFFVL